jgi:hypothetical protein
MTDLGFVVPCIFKYSIKHPTRCTFSLTIIAFSCRHHLICFGYHCAHHQEPPQSAFAASGYLMIARAFSCRHHLICFGYHCAHHQEPPQPAFAAFGYLMTARSGRVSSCKLTTAGNRSTPGNHKVTIGCKDSLRRLLMMGTMVPETC